MYETLTRWKEQAQAIGGEYGPLLLRVGMAIVFLYFGTQQLRSPESFIGWLPPEVALLPLSARTFVVLNGGFETFCGLLLLIGMFSRTCAFLLGAHLLGITYTIGWSEIGVRDLGLSLATLAIVMIGSGPWSVDHLFAPSRGSGGSIRESLGTTDQTKNQQPQYGQ